MVHRFPTMLPPFKAELANDRTKSATPNLYLRAGNQKPGLNTEMVPRIILDLFSKRYPGSSLNLKQHTSPTILMRLFNVQIRPHTFFVPGDLRPAANQIKPQILLDTHLGSSLSPGLWVGLLQSTSAVVRITIALTLAPSHFPTQTLWVSTQYSFSTATHAQSEK